MTLSCNRPVRVFLADRHPIFLAGLKTFLSRDSGVDIVGEASSAAQLAQFVGAATPDVAIVDVDFSVIEVISTIMAQAPGIRVIGLADKSESLSARRAMMLGARGFVSKQSSGETVLRAIVTVARGGQFIDASVAHRAPADETSLSGLRHKATLTMREQEVLKLIALGFSARDAASRIGITVKSVETYKARATAKLAIDSRQQIVQYGIVHGWFQ